MGDPPQRLPLEHLLRPALPWHTITHPPARTECGRPTDGLAIITREQCAAKIRRQGQQRAAMTTCMTCATTSDRHQPWDADPVEAMRRAIGGWGNDDPQLRDELIALAALAQAHPDEFSELLTGLRAAPRLDEARAARRRAQLPRKTR